MSAAIVRGALCGSTSTSTDISFWTGGKSNMLRAIITAGLITLACIQAHAQPMPVIEPVQAKVSAFEPINIRWSNMPTSLNSATATLINTETNAAVYNVSLDLSNAEKKRQGAFKFEGTLPGQYEVRVVATGSNYVVARTTVAIFDPNATSIAPPAAPPVAGPQPSARRCV